MKAKLVLIFILTGNFLISHAQSTTLYNYISINEIKMWIGNDGDGSSPTSDIDMGGLFWPGGEKGEVTAVYHDGLFYAGKVNGVLHANGNYYRAGFQPGNILENGLPANSADPLFKIWKVRADWLSLPEGETREVYKNDYLNWPVEIGAPWIDNNGDGIFTGGIDKPELIGDEALFYVVNDLNEAKTENLFGTKPIGLEIQVLVYGYNTPGVLSNVVFKKYKIINKSPNNIDSMYLAYWADPELGNGIDDFAGCDTALNLTYCYNSDNMDEDWKFSGDTTNHKAYGTPPPAVGHMLLQGPSIPGLPKDSAFIGGQWQKGFINLPMTSAIIYLCGDQDLRFACPTYFAEGSVHLYNNLRGLGRNGQAFIDTSNGKPTLFCLSGDPVNKTGWYEGEGWLYHPNPGDRYYLNSSGPFNMKPGETQEFVVAILIAQGTDNLNSVTELKKSAAGVLEMYRNGKMPPASKNILPENIELFQCYPNPFNSGTAITYQLSSATNVRLIVYDILGRQVTELVNEEQQPDIYNIKFNAKNLSSGIYFYSLSTNSFTQTRKMIILK